MDTKLKPPTFYLGTVPVTGDVILAPMDGLSDSPFRRIARSFGSALSYSEFINAQEVISDSGNFYNQARFFAEERPLIYQIYDDDPDRILSAARRLLAFQPDAIDINMGCSVKRVSRRGAGAGLLQSPQKIAQIISSLKADIPVPITAKIRLGWNENQKNYLEIGKIIQESGASLIAVHARTKEQAYQGEADWDAIAELKNALSIPVIGNGDVKSVNDIEKMLRHTHCDAVMIGRASIGNPWIFQKTHKSKINNSEIHKVVVAHLNLSLQFYGQDDGLIRFRKHAKRYLDHLAIPEETLFKLLTCKTPPQFLLILDQIFCSL